MRLVTLDRDFIKVWDVRTKDLLVEVENAIGAKFCRFSKCNSYILAGNSKPYFSIKCALFHSKTLDMLKAGDICGDTCLTYKDNYQMISPSFNDSFNASIRIEHIHFPTAETLLVANRCCSKPFEWKSRKCVIFSKSSQSASPLVVYDFINEEIIDVFHINCFPSHCKIIYISNLDETHFLICLNYCHIFLLSFETSAESPRVSFVNNADVKCCALSPDNLYFACCYNNSVLTVRSVDTGETLQTVVLKQPPAACWWSELYLWVVCKSVVVKYPYDSTQRKVLGNELEECTINFDVVLKFAKDALVIRYAWEISILRFCNEKLCPQQISDSESFLHSATTAIISSDGCAVLLYDEHNSDYQLWEIACKNRWELHSAGRFDGRRVRWLFLTGTKNSRSSVWLYLGEDDIDSAFHLSSVDFSNSVHRSTHKRTLSVVCLTRVIYGDSKYLIIVDDSDWIHFVKVADGKITTSLYLGELASLRWNVSSFYITSRSLLLLVGKTDINIFKIHNIENYSL
ncbi:---NA--- [Paramuricea clavata]|uniref:---NA n=1 Tax=Paramuricea clavata TaxID=317549 RepID=A0A6S7L5J3_PARCT|nr:---NA--- [Paramuricea clavata]